MARASGQPAHSCSHALCNGLQTHMLVPSCHGPPAPSQVHHFPAVPDLGFMSVGVKPGMFGWSNIQQVCLTGDMRRLDCATAGSGCLRTVPVGGRLKPWSSPLVLLVSSRA